MFFDALTLWVCCSSKPRCSAALVVCLASSCRRGACMAQEREAALSELQHRLDRRAAELEELRSSTHAALSRR